MPRLRRPRPLPRDGTVGIAAPSGPVDPERLAAGEALLQAAGLRTIRREDVVDRCGYLAGDDRRRARELQELIDDERVDAVLCARGGYGAHRIVDLLDARRFRAARKPLIGYSDATTLLLWQRRRAGLVGFHGPMLERSEGMGERELDALLRALRGDEKLPIVWKGDPGGAGRREGRLVGGSLSLVVASLGTPWEIDTRGAILLLEEVSERPYRIDRMLQQLRAARKLSGAAGVGIGALVDCESPSPDSPGPYEVIGDCLGALGVPWVHGLPFGHAPPNLPWPVGARAAIDGERGELHILEAGVTSR